MMTITPQTTLSHQLFCDEIAAFSKFIAFNNNKNMGNIYQINSDLPLNSQTSFHSFNSIWCLCFTLTFNIEIDIKRNCQLITISTLTVYYFRDCRFIWSLSLLNGIFSNRLRINELLRTKCATKFGQLFVFYFAVTSRTSSEGLMWFLSRCSDFNGEYTERPGIHASNSA